MTAITKAQHPYKHRLKCLNVATAVRFKRKPKKKSTERCWVRLRLDMKAKKTSDIVISRSGFTYKNKEHKDYEYKKH